MNARSVTDWLDPRLARAAELARQEAPARREGAESSSKLSLGIDLGTSDVVSMLVDADAMPVAVCLDWADVVRDGVVWDFFGAVRIVRGHLEKLRAALGPILPERATTSFPPGTDPRISVNVIEAADLDVVGVVDEPSSVAALLRLDRAAVVDIGGGTTGIAVVDGGKIVYSGDEPTGGHHVSLTLAGHRGISLEEAEAAKRDEGNGRRREEIWPIVRPVFEKMAAIVQAHLRGPAREYAVDTLYLSGGSTAMPGVQELFAQVFHGMRVILPRHPLHLTPLAIAAYGLSGEDA
ncbi:MAG: ethanolamine utilization protein EutJ [Candidatus Accumulibacter sp.]|jgi:ethanolamine utilization protein EutJ|nr:ethanolamine utilization protein EutJ [Accumulibacter sp.]